MPSSDWMWCPISCAITYAAAKSPGAPKRRDRSWKNERSRHTLSSAGPEDGPVGGDAAPQPLIVPDVKITTGARLYCLPEFWKTCVHMSCVSLDTNFANSSALSLVAEPPVLS